MGRAFLPVARKGSSSLVISPEFNVRAGLYDVIPSEISIYILNYIPTIQDPLDNRTPLATDRGRISSTEVSRCAARQVMVRRTRQHVWRCASHWQVCHACFWLVRPLLSRAWPRPQVCRHSPGMEP